MPSLENVTISVTRYIEDVSSTRWQYVDPDVANEPDYLALNISPFNQNVLYLRRIQSTIPFKQTRLGRDSGNNIPYSDGTSGIPLFTYEMGKERRKYEVLQHKSISFTPTTLQSSKSKKISRYQLRLLSLNQPNCPPNPITNIPYYSSL
jgi:hypothetical protein